MIDTKLYDLPLDVHGFTICDNNGDYTIYLNARHTRENNKKAYMHELKHIRKGDFYSVDNADAVESRTL